MAAASDSAIFLAVAQAKGGVGKTTSAINLAAALVETGHEVLVVDLDPQGGAARALGVAPDGRATAYELIVTASATLDQAVRSSPSGVDVVPATESLAAALFQLPSRTTWQWSLVEALEPARERWRYVIIDTPPSLGTLSTIALAAARWVLVPTQLEAASWRAAGEMLRHVADMRSYGPRPLNPELALLGVLPTFIDLRSRFARELLDEMRAAVNIPLLADPGVKRAIAFHEATLLGQTILEYAPASDAAESFRRLAREVIDATR